MTRDARLLLVFCVIGLPLAAGAAYLVYRKWPTTYRATNYALGALVFAVMFPLVSAITGADAKSPPYLSAVVALWLALCVVDFSRHQGVQMQTYERARMSSKGCHALSSAPVEVATSAKTIGAPARGWNRERVPVKGVAAQRLELGRVVARGAILALPVVGVPIVYSMGASATAGMFAASVFAYGCCGLLQSRLTLSFVVGQLEQERTVLQVVNAMATGLRELPETEVGWERVTPDGLWSARPDNRSWWRTLVVLDTSGRHRDAPPLTVLERFALAAGFAPRERLTSVST